MQTGHTLAVRRAVATDRPRLAAPLSDMQAHYGSPDPPGGAAEMARLLTRPGERRPFALIAERRGALLGRALLAAAARTALEEDYCRIDWTTDATNRGAQRLYDGLGVPRQDKRFYRLAGDDLKKFARG